MLSRHLNPPKTTVGKSLPSLRRVRKQNPLRERAIQRLLIVCALVSIFTTIGIVIMLAVQAAGFFSKVSILEFFTGTKWTPLFQPQHFGVLPLVGGTLLTAGIAILVALPLGLASAIYLSE